MSCDAYTYMTNPSYVGARLTRGMANPAKPEGRLEDRDRRGHSRIAALESVGEGDSLRLTVQDGHDGGCIEEHQSGSFNES